MKTIPWSVTVDKDALCAQVAPVLMNGGLVCLPCSGRYRIVADLTNADAVISLMQSKGRVHNAPALVFIDDEAQLAQVAGEVDPIALTIARALWPRPLTIRVKPNQDLPSKVLKQLGGSKCKVGVRIPRDPLARIVAQCMGRPLLVSSANREKKSGDSSPAQVRKNFAARVDIFIDRGDLASEPPSTVIDIKNGKIVVERAGEITREELASFAGG